MYWNLIWRVSSCRFWRDLRRAWDARNAAELTLWNRCYCAGRDCAEARAETLQMGYSLVRLLEALDLDDAAIALCSQRFVPVSFPLAYSCATSLWQIPSEQSMQAYAWSWAENQVSAALKTVPLGQVAGQRLLLAARCEKIPAAVQVAVAKADADLSNFAPGLAIAGRAPRNAVQSFV